ncbi:MAG: Mov34/MPN/PAD-1 family protein [Verrucomicrobiales bacterium]
MTSCNHYFVFELQPSSQDGTRGESAILRLPKSDWRRAVEALHLEALRMNTDYPRPRSEVVISPVWDEELGQPYVNQLSVSFKDGTLGICLPVANYFHGAARDFTEQWCREKGDGGGGALSARFLAYPDSFGGKAARSSFQIEESDPPVAFKEDLSFENLLSRSVAMTEEPDDNLYTFVAEQVVGEITAAADAAGELECGGILLGHLRRFPDRPGVIGVEISAQIPAPHQLAEATPHSIRFNEQVWDAVQAARNLRGDDVSILGWVHSHPARHWEKCPPSCPPQARKNCPRERLQHPFFSRDDESVHQHFSRAFHMALLVHCGETATTVANFGWCLGRIRSRSWHLLDPKDPVATPAKSRETNSNRNQTQTH